MRRYRLPLFFALMLTALIAAPAFAGGWATVSVDQPSIDGWQPGQPQQVKVTLLQHGVTPVTEGTVSFTLTNAATGEEVTGTARAAGEGAWIATITVPSDGSWALTVRHSFLETTQGGPIPITIAPAAAGNLAPAATGSSGMAPTGAPLVVLFLGLGVALAALAAVAVILVARPERDSVTRAR